MKLGTARAYVTWPKWPTVLLFYGPASLKILNEQHQVLVCQFALVVHDPLAVLLFVGVIGDPQGFESDT